MKAIRSLLIVALITALQLNLLQAQGVSVKNYDFTVSGTSTLHDWESRVEKIECNASLVIVNNALSDVERLVVTIPVKAIKSTKGKIMDNKTWEAFHYEKYPSITFTLTQRTLNVSDHSIEVTGDLTMAGVTRRIQFTAAYKSLPDGDMEVIGSKQLRMTDFKMEPPTAMMGTIKVGDQITIAFQLVLTQNQTL